MNRFQKRVTVLALTLAAVAGLSGAVVYWSFNAGETPARFYANYEHNDDGTETQPVSEPVAEQTSNNLIGSNTMVTSDTTVYYHMYYTSCEHDSYMIREQGPLGIVGFTKAQIEQSFPAYTIEEFTTSELVLSHYVDELCPDCLAYVYIGVSGGKVAVFHGKPGRTGPVKHLTDISVNLLPEDQQMQLKQGIPVENNDIEINSILEGLNR